MTTQAWTVQSRAQVPVADVHIPFTAPLLSGVRGRRQRTGLEFILPNPSGGRGTYVVSWSQAAGLAAPTLHDTILAKRLHELPSLTPAAVRSVARLVAAEGYVGREAAEAAIRSQTKIEAETLRLWAMFLLALIQRSEIPGPEQGRILASLGNAGPGIVTDGFVAAAGRLGWEPSALSDALGQLSTAFLPMGAKGQAQRLLGLMEALHPALLAEQTQHAQDAAPSPALLARTINGVSHGLGLAAASLDGAARALADPAALLVRWRTDPAGALGAARHVEETLDGWDRICLLWLDADTLSARLGLLPEIGLLVRLAGAATAADADTAAAGRGNGAQGQPGVPDAPAAQAQAGRQEREAPRGAPAPGLVERNERIRARELTLEHGDG